MYIEIYGCICVFICTYVDTRFSCIMLILSGLCVRMHTVIATKEGAIIFS